MNQFFLKPLLPTSSSDEQSDYERLLQLCVSYGLNQQETQQLMDEFKKGGYDKVNSMRSSLNQSMMSDQYDENQKQTSNVHSHQKQELRTYSNNFYQHEHQEQSHPAKSTDRYYGYEEQQHDKVQQNYGSDDKKYYQYQDDQISYNQMTFNHEEENQQERVSPDVNMKISQFKNNTAEINKNLKSNESKHSLTAKSTQNAQHNSSQRNSIHQSSHNQSTSSAHSQNSYHSQQNQQLNPVYVKQLIQNFQLLQKQTDDLKQKNNVLLKQQNSIKIENQMLKKQYEQIKKQRDQLKVKNNLFESQNYQLKSALQSQKTKTETFKSIKQRDSQIIQGLKDSILQFTAILKEKDAQSNDLQNKLILMYEKNEKLNQQIYGSGQQNGGSVAKIFGKLGSKKSLASQNDEKEERSSITNQVRKDQLKDIENENRKQSEIKRPKDRSQARRELSEIILNGMNNQQVHEMGVSQSNKQLIKEVSTSKIMNSQGELQSMQRQSTTAQRRPPRQIKENVFVGVQVQGGQNFKGMAGKRTITQEQSKRRGSSRVDIRKYKGMIQQLRNSYSNVPGNMIR